METTNVAYKQWLEESEESIIVLDKAAENKGGRVTIDDIQDSLAEYRRLFKAGLASPAEILTLYRAFPEISKYAEVVELLDLNGEDEPVVVGGPASVELVDREGHLITLSALDQAFERYMNNFRARNVMVMHSDVQVGHALPAFISKSGQIFKSGVEGNGLFFIAELRNDTKIGLKVADQVREGKMRSYSIAGSATKTQNITKGANTIMQVDQLELAEVTICLVAEVPVWTSSGLKAIKDIEVGEEVLTHKNRWRKVLHTMVNEVDEDIYRITTSDGKTVEGITGNHPVRKLVYGGQNTGTHYEWVDASEIQVGDTIQAHYSTGVCDYCERPLFKTLKKDQRNFCSTECRYAAPGNMTGRTYVDPNKGITKAENPNLTGGIRTEEGRNRQLEAVTSESFRQMRSEKMKERIASDPDFAAELFLRGRGHGGRVELTKPEQFVADLLDDQWEVNRYFEGKFPDFLSVDLQKAIEVYGDYWHKDDNPQDRIDFFADKGIESIVIWESEIKANPSEVTERVLEFVGNALVKVEAIETYRHTGKVYNIEVEEDNSYVTEAFTVHNCEKGVNQGAHFELMKAEQSVPASRPGSFFTVVSKADIPSFTEIFTAWFNKANLIEDLDKKQLAVLMNENARQLQHRGLLNQLGFPEEVDLERSRYAPVTYDEPGNPVSPVIVNEAGQELGDPNMEEMRKAVNDFKAWMRKEEEGGMAKTQLDRISDLADMLHELIDEDDDLPGWVQNKISDTLHNMEASVTNLKYEDKQDKGLVKDFFKWMDDVR